MGDIAKLLAVLAASSVLCCSAAGPQTPDPLGEGAILREAPLPVAPADPAPPGLDFAPIQPAPVPAPATNAQEFFAVDDDNHLLRFTSATPESVAAVGISGLAAGEHLVGIATRRSDGALFVLGGSSRMYTLDAASAVATARMDTSFAPLLDGSSFGFAFDDLDHARVASDSEQNIGLDPVTGWVANFDVPLAFRDEDPHAASDPDVVAMAFARGDFFTIDAKLDVLASMRRAADGQLATVGALGVDVSAVAGFDVAVDGQAFAALVSGGKTALYRIDLDTGAATSLGALGTKTPLRGLTAKR